MRRLTQRLCAAGLCVTFVMVGVVVAPNSTAAAVPGFDRETSDPEVELVSDWAWPVADHRLTRPFIAPAHEYGPGHRGIDIGSLGGAEVLAPDDGVVAYSGSIAGRGILTIDHGDGLVTTLEPVTSSLQGGALVQRGQQVALLSVGGHAAPGELHFGVRLDGEYINPLLLLGGVPRAVLLPCCAPLAP